MSQSAPIYLLDANLLLRLIEPGHPQHLAAVQCVRSLMLAEAALILAPQGIYEFLAVATRSVAVRGLGFSVTQADQDALRAEKIFTLLPDNMDVYLHWRRLVRNYGTHGKNSHDARLVAFMLAHGITHLLTFNGDDFRRYLPEGISIVDPATAGAASISTSNP